LLFPLHLHYLRLILLLFFLLVLLRPLFFLLLLQDRKTAQSHQVLRSFTYCAQGKPAWSTFKKKKKKKCQCQ
jgi:hypothetical protein